MLKHYFTSAWRTLNKYRMFSLTNIGGLALGLAAFWAIALYIGDEWSYDRFLPTSGQVYRAVSYSSWDGGQLNTATSSPPFARMIQNGSPEVETTVRLDMEGGGKLRVGDKKFEVPGILVADSTFFQVFPYPVLYGDARTPLSTAGALVLTRSLASTLFGTPEAALGKTVIFGDNMPLTVTAVIKDVPPNTHLSFNALRSWQPQDETGSLMFYNIYTYVLLKKGVDPRHAESALTRAFSPLMVSKMSTGSTYRMELQSLPSIHLHSNLAFEIGRNGDARNIYIFIAAALLILSIAVINYMNLSTARSSLRVKEVGVRKAIGSPRKPLVYLFLAESVIIALLASFLGLLLLELLLPLFNTLSGKELSLVRLGMVRSTVLLFGCGLLIGIGSGLYPALFMSGFGILHSLKGQMGKQSGTTFLRKSLVTFQFVITIGMLSASCLVYLQLRYMGNADLGFNKDQVVAIHIHDHAVRRQVEALRTKLLESPLIEEASGASNTIGLNDIGQRNYGIEREDGSKRSFLMGNILQVDRHFLSTLQIPLVGGRNFLPDHPSDSSDGLLVNEAFVNQAGWSDPIGKTVAYFLDDKGLSHEAKVLGVTKDFNIYSLQHAIAPLAMYLPQVPDDADNLYVRLGKGHISEALNYFQTTYKGFSPGESFDYHFLDQNFSRQYEQERREGYVLLSFTVLAVLLACLGLFGLVSFSASRRVKEIGIRKVLGAGRWGIVTLLAGDLLRLVVLAALIAGPLAWWAMNRWLQAFAYRIPVYWWVIVGAGIAAAAIALATMIAQALKAARANPIDALKYE